MGSDNPSGADNQQETASSPILELDPRWVVGFVDGEGCFSVSVHRNANARSTGGWQLHPVFHVYQHQRYRAVLEAMTSVFGCGRLRPKGPNSSVWSYVVDGLPALEGNVVRFFERHPLVVKADDFERFAAIVRAMRQKEHLDERGVRTALATGLRDEPRRQAQRSRSIEEILGSSETARQARNERTPSLFS
jgi:LAGLIDADG DNA endonuclease family protein